MTPLQLTIKAALAGAIADDLSDKDLIDVLSTITEDGDPELNTEEASHVLNRSPITLKKWRAKGFGPRYRKDQSGFVRYRRSWLDEFNELGQVVDPQAADGQART